MSVHNHSRREFLRFMGLGGAGLALTTGGVMACTKKSDTSNTQADGARDKVLRIGYLPITDAGPLLVAHGNGYYEDEGLRVDEPYRFRGWSQIAEGFLAKKVDVAHLLMPTTIWMRFAQKLPIKVVAWNHTDGSAIAVSNDINEFTDLAGKVVAIPYWYSVHNVVLQNIMRHHGLKVADPSKKTIADDEIQLVVMAPADMPTSLANGSIKGYIVAEPFCAMAEVKGIGKILRFTGDVWLHHACCVVVMHEDTLRDHPEWAQSVLNANVRAQKWMRENREDAAILLSDEGKGYLPQGLDAVKKTLMDYDQETYGPTGAIQHKEWDTQRIDYLPFPFPSYTAALVNFLKQTYVEGDTKFLGQLDPDQAHKELVDDRFVRKAIEEIGGLEAFGLPNNYIREETIEV